MKATNYPRWILAGLMGLTTASSSAAEPAAGKPATTDAPLKVAPLKVSSTKESVGSIDTVTRVFVTTETNRFTFLLPKGFRLTSDEAEHALSLAAPDAAGLIKLRISEQAGKEEASKENAAREKPELKPDKVRETLLESQPDARILKEFAASAGNLSGQGFELQWRSATGSMVSSRIAIIPFPGGMLEFSLTALTQRIRQLDWPLNQVMLSFRQAPIQGKLDIAPLSDKF